MTTRIVPLASMIVFLLTACGGAHPPGGTTMHHHGSARGEKKMSEEQKTSLESDTKKDEKEKDKGTKKAVKPIGESSAVDLSKMKTLSDIIKQVSGKKIFYVGEYHNQLSNHEVQLEVIKKLHARNPKMAVGMEMFQLPSQKVLDDFIAGRTYERVFLKESEYFKRWRFDYNFYKPILDFCREFKIPVVALNIPREITEKVSKKGLDALTEDEKKDIPADIDLSDEEYRDRLKEVFQQHGNTDEKSFEYFFQAQVLWDETMAESIDRFLKKHPDHRMVVIAGNGHLTFGSGIPKRTFRRNGYAYALILNDVDIEQGIADFVIYPESVEPVTAPKMMVMLKEEENTVTISGFARDSVSEKAGLKKGDRILSVDGAAIADVQDLRISLFYKAKEDTLKVKVLRKRFLFGDRELEFEVKLL